MSAQNDDTSPELPVLYRDELLIAVNKPSGMIVHRGWDDDKITVADIVRDRIIGNPVFAVHRLDRATSGVLLFALTADGARYMQTQLQQERLQKYYIALVRGPMRDPVFLCHPVPKRQDSNERADAITEFRPIAHQGRWSLVSAKPITGRLHQIRRHLKHLSHHIVGDVRYGKGDINRYFRQTFSLQRLALHARSVKFLHPDGQLITITASLPPDLAEPLQSLGIWSPSIGM